MRISDWSSDVCSSDLESGSNWLWESDESGCLAYVSPQFGELLGQDHQSLVGKKLVDLFRPHMGAGAHKSGLPILEFNLAARLVFREVILPVSSEESRVGKECVSTCRAGWSPYL